MSSLNPPPRAPDPAGSSLGTPTPIASNAASASPGAPRQSTPAPRGPRSTTRSIARNTRGEGWCTEKTTIFPPPREPAQRRRHRRRRRRVQPGRRLVQNDRRGVRDELRRAPRADARPRSRPRPEARPKRRTTRIDPARNRRPTRRRRRSFSAPRTSPGAGRVVALPRRRRRRPATPPAIPPTPRPAFGRRRSKRGAAANPRERRADRASPRERRRERNREKRRRDERKRGEARPPRVGVPGPTDEAVRDGRQAQVLQHPRDALAPLLRGRVPREFERRRVRDGLADGEERGEVVVRLRHERHRLAEGLGRDAGAVQRRAPGRHPHARRRVRAPGNRAEQGALPSAGGAEHGDRLAARERPGDVAKERPRREAKTNLLFFRGETQKRRAAPRGAFAPTPGSRRRRRRRRGASAARATTAVRDPSEDPLAGEPDAPGRSSSRRVESVIATRTHRAVVSHVIPSNASVATEEAAGEASRFAASRRRRRSRRWYAVAAAAANETAAAAPTQRAAFVETEPRRSRSSEEALAGPSEEAARARSSPPGTSPAGVRDTAVRVSSGAGGGASADARSCFASISAMHAGSSVHRAATAIIPLTVSPARWSGTTLASAHAWKGTASGPVTRYPASTRRSLKSHRHRSHRASPRSGSQLAPRLASRRTASMSTGHSRDTPGAPICARAAEEQCRRRSTSEAPRLFPRRARRGGREGWRTNPPRGFARGARGDARRARGAWRRARGRDDARGDAGRRRARARARKRGDASVRRPLPAPRSALLGHPRLLGAPETNLVTTTTTKRSRFDA